MGHSFDYFVGSLQCPVCGKLSEADQSTNMQTSLRDEPELAFLGIGHPLELNRETIKNNGYRDRGYLTIQVPKPDEIIRVLQTWECPSCGQPFNWAEIAVRDGIIETISSVTLNADQLRRSHLISDEAVSVAAALTRKSFDDLVGEDIVQILRDRL